jgi:hypothetical protein
MVKGILQSQFMRLCLEFSNVFFQFFTSKVLMVYGNYLQEDNKDQKPDFVSTGFFYEGYLSLQQKRIFPLLTRRSIIRHPAKGM